MTQNTELLRKVNTELHWGALLNPISILRTLKNNRELIRQFTWRGLAGRYRGSFLGLFWSLLHPMFMLVIYTFIFNIVFKSRWGANPNEGEGEFALALFCGLTVYSIFGESVGRSTSLVLENPNYVKRVVFPLEILAVASLGTTMLHACISLLILIAGSLFIHGGIPLSALYLPIVILPLVCFSLGISWFISSLGVFIRDTQQFIPVLLQVLIFLTPVFYPLTAVPVGMQNLLSLNPLAYFVGTAREVFLWGAAPDPKRWAFAMVISLIVMQLGYAWFMKSKKAFADVI